MSRPDRAGYGECLDVALSGRGRRCERKLSVINHVDRRTLELRLLGPMEACVDGVSVSVSGPRRRALLIRLALSANEVVSKDRLIDDLWGEDPPPTAAKSLHVQVSQLRDVLRMAGGVSAKDDEVLVTRQSGYMLRLDPDSLDVSRFEQSCAAAREALEQHATRASWRHLPGGIVALAWSCPRRRVTGIVRRRRDRSVGGAPLGCDRDAHRGRPGAVWSRRDHQRAGDSWSRGILSASTSGGCWPWRCIAQDGKRRLCGHALVSARSSARNSVSIPVSKSPRSSTGSSSRIRHWKGAPPAPISVDMDLSVASQPRAVLGYRTNLPRIPTPFIGGERLLEEIAEQLRVSNVVTLTGTGGVGKTRAAIEFGHRHVAEFDRGVFFVDLAPVSNTGAVIDAVASTLPLVALGEQSLIDTVVDWIGDRRVLLVIDNCEHLVGEVAVLVEDLIGRCWNLQILATSREALRVPNEHVYCVPSLAADGPAVELFCERARAIDPSFTVDGHRDALIADLRASRRHPVGDRTAPRHVHGHSRSRSCWSGCETGSACYVAAAAAHSIGTTHCEPRFHGRTSCSVQTSACCSIGRRCSQAGSTCVPRSWSAGSTRSTTTMSLDLVSSLVDKSMIVADRGAVGMRYRLLETLRQYGEDQLELRGETAPVARSSRHVLRRPDR